MSNYLQPHELQHARVPCPSPSPRDCPSSCPLSWWCHPTISSCHPLLLLLSIFPRIRVFSSESALRIRWPKYWGGFSFSISPSNEYSRLISFRIDCFDLLVVQGTLKSLLQHHSSKASILWHSAFFWKRKWQPTPVFLRNILWTEEPGGLLSIGSCRVRHIWSNLVAAAAAAFFIVQLSHPYMATRKTIALTRWTFAGKVISLLFNMLSRLVLAFLQRSKHLLISWLQSPSAVILEPKKVCHCFHCFPIYLPWSDGAGCRDLFSECWVLNQLFHSHLLLSSPI